MNDLLLLMAKLPFSQNILTSIESSNLITTEQIPVLLQFPASFFVVADNIRTYVPDFSVLENELCTYLFTYRIHYAEIIWTVILINLNSLHQH